MDLFEHAETRFDGSTFEPAIDGARLKGQLQRVYNAMADGEWHTLRQLSEVASGSEASVSARLRDLRKTKFGSHTIARKRLDGGLWVYRMAA